MLVETFEVLETDCEGNVEQDAEAIALIEKLGLDGQKSLIHGAGDKAERCPYRKMSVQEQFIYERICPQKTKLSEYSDGPIPLRVLQVAAHARELFQECYVWSATSVDMNDPVLVGRKGSEYSPELFILARWGEVLEPLDVLAKKACEIFRGWYAAEINKAIGTLKSGIEQVAVMADSEITSRTRWHVYGSNGF